MSSKEFDRLARDVRALQPVFSQAFTVFISRLDDFIYDVELFQIRPNEDDVKASMTNAGLLLLSVCNILKVALEEIEEDVDKLFGYAHIEW